MITLQKLLTELNVDSLNEIVAGGGCSKGGSHKSKSAKSHKVKSAKTIKNKSQKSCGCPPGSKCPF